MPRSDVKSHGQEIGVPADNLRRWLIAIAAMVSAVMELVDTSAVNVSLLYIAGNLSASVNKGECRQTNTKV